MREKVTVCCTAIFRPAWEQIRPSPLIADGSKSGETPMNKARIALAASVALIFISSAALAQQTLTGMVTKINRITGTVAIQQTQTGTVGSSSGAAAEEFKAQDGMLNTLHAGDRVKFSVSDTDGAKTITKLEKQ